MSPMRKPQFLGRVPTTALIIVLVAFALAMIPLGFYLGQTAQTATSQRDTATQQLGQANTKVNQGKTLAQQVQAACVAGGTTEQQLQALGACHQATVVQQPQTPIPGPSGATGATGANGANGRGIVSTAIVNGDLVLSFNQPPLTQDVGHISGATGTTGATGSKGADGRGITASAVSSAGDLVLTYSDGTTTDVGHVVGATGAVGATGPQGMTGTAGTNGTSGRGVSAASINASGYLVLTYTDGTTDTLGPVVGAQGAPGPTGATGATGAQGPPPVSYSIMVPDSLGGYTKENCVETATNPPSDSYTCTPATTGGG